MSDLDKVKGEILRVKTGLPQRSGIVDIVLDETDGTIIVIKDDQRRVPWSIVQFRREYAHFLE